MFILFILMFYFIVLIFDSVVVKVFSNCHNVQLNVIESIAAVSRPRSFNEVRTRVELNLQYYQFNYIALCGLITMIAILSQPSLLLTLIVLFGLWLYTMSVEAIKFGNFELRGRQKSMAYSAFAIVLLFLVNGSTIFTLVGLCGAAVLIHAALHNLTDDEQQSIEMASDNLV